ncbi:hypothetical protein [Streptomyces hainanensis]|uniref:hypothetical protein n=1 Tax=Streptomyces hainanensis TaxID=402648 RepID=UPI00104D2883|nr:hypothetical protein [Streptomyces hainanensis]
MATGFFMIGVRALSFGLKLPDDVRARMPQQSRRQELAFYILTPVFAAAVLGVNLLRPEPTSAILFMYSAAMVAIPLGFLPVRGRMVRAYVAQQRSPDTPMKLDRPSMVWVVGFFSVVILAATLALMTTTYGTNSH